MERIPESLEALRHQWPSSDRMSDGEVLAVASLIREKDRAIRELTAERIGAGLVLAALLAAVTIAAAFHAVWLLAQVGYGLMGASNAAAAAVYWVYRRRGRAAPHVGLDSQAYYAELLRFYDGQVQFLRTAKYWYVLPLLVGVVLIGLGIWTEAGDAVTAVMVGVVVPVAAWMGIQHVNERWWVADLLERRQQLRQWLLEVGMNID